MTEPQPGGPVAVEAAGADAQERRWHLEDERDFLRRSLADLVAEHDAGDIEDDDYVGLANRDRRRLAAVEAELADLVASPPVAPDEPSRQRTEKRRSTDGRAAKRRRPRWLAVVAVLALSAGATLLAVELASPRLPGQPETGTAAQNLAQRVVTQLNQATVLVNEGTSSALNQAVALYEAILVEDPDQPQALAELGYLEWEAGYAKADTALERSGESSVERSLAVESNDSAAHLFMGTIDLEGNHDPAAAVTQYRDFLAEHPPKSELDKAAALVREAFSDAGLPVPAGVPAG